MLPFLETISDDKTWTMREVPTHLKTCEVIDESEGNAIQIKSQAISTSVPIGVSCIRFVTTD